MRDGPGHRRPSAPPPTQSPGDLFGRAVAICGKTAVAGACGYTSEGADTVVMGLWRTETTAVVAEAKRVRAIPAPILLHAFLCMNMWMTCVRKQKACGQAADAGDCGRGRCSCQACHLGGCIVAMCIIRRRKLPTWHAVMADKRSDVNAYFIRA